MDTRGREDASGQVRAREAVPGPHDLRHTAASLAIASGANVKAVQAMLGHGSAKMTLDRYGHLFDRSLDDVGKAMGDLVSRYRSGTTGSHEAAS